MLSPLQIRFDSWMAERRTLSAFLDAKPSFRAALADLQKYHELTEFSIYNQADFEPLRLQRDDGRLSLLAFAIERRQQRFGVKNRKRPPEGIAPAFDGCPLAIDNIFWQQAGKQFPYLKSINGNPYYWLTQLQSFGRDHFTIAAASREPQDWRPSQTLLHRRLVDAATITALLGCLVLYNGDGAGDSIPDWFHLHGLCAPESPLPVQQAFTLAALPSAPVQRIAEPYWPLPAYRITGSAEAIAGEVTKLANRYAGLAGRRATESIAMFPEDGAVVCIYVPRDREREWVTEFGGKLGAFEVATGSLVFSAPDRCAKLRDEKLGFDELWAMLRGARPGWCDEL